VAAALPPVAEPARGEVSFAHWRGEDKAAFDSIVGEFARLHPEAVVQQDIAPSQDYQANALQRLKGGAIGDVFAAFRGGQFTSMVEAGLFGDLSAQLFTDNYRPKLVRGGRDAGGRQLGLPYQLVFPVPIANQDLLARVGVTAPPQDWGGFLALCEALKGAGVVPLAWPGAEPGNAGQLFSAMVMNNAPSDDACARLATGETKVTDDWFLRTLEQYAQLRPYIQDNAAGTQVEPVQLLFAQGRAGMLATGSYHLAAVRKLGAAFPIGLVPPITVGRGEQPRHVGVYNATFILGVNAASENVPGALRFLEFLSDPAVASTYANATAQHLTVADVDYQDPDLRALGHWLDADTMLAARYQIEDIDMRNAVEGACAKVLTGTDPARAAEEAQRVVDQRRPS
jgi:raffinose/stachyose/melibiose transport system substrate-binding protein